jgi:hypothetical protein
MSKVIKWGELTAEERDRLVHDVIMGESVEACESPDNSPVPSYTTSMDAAWKVLSSHAPITHKLVQELGGFVELRAIGFSVLQNWTPELICIAALLACGVQVDTQP